MTLSLVASMMVMCSGFNTPASFSIATTVPVSKEAAIGNAPTIQVHEE